MNLPFNLKQSHQQAKSAKNPGGGHFHSKVIGMLVVFLEYKILILVFFWGLLENFWKMEAIFPKTALKIAICVFFRGLKSKSGYFLWFSKKISYEHTYHFYIKNAPPPGQKYVSKKGKLRSKFFLLA